MSGGVFHWLPLVMVDRVPGVVSRADVFCHCGLPSLFLPSLVQNQPCLPIHRSEEHTSELQSPCNLVCRLLLEKKKNDSKPRASTALSKLRFSAAWLALPQHI